jgi:hypothetical protein
MSHISVSLLPELHSKTSDMRKNNSIDIYIEPENMWNKGNFLFLCSSMASPITHSRITTYNILERMQVEAVM